MKLINFFIPTLILLLQISCSGSEKPGNDVKKIIVGAERFEEYLPDLKDKNVAVVANHTSLVGSTHLVDSLINLNINVNKIFCPEHGFRGEAEAGAKISNQTDSKTGLPIISLYGNGFKPKTQDLTGLDILLFDIQDVGVRFYTYISTLYYVMDACAENNIELIVLDRPNPNGFYVDGPLLDTNFRSFVGIIPVPLVHGMTIGELAQMINGEKWIHGNCNLKVIPCSNYTHKSFYQLTVKPSPNLPNMQSVYLYPSLGLFEGTVISVGRGTNFPFQVYGHPDFPDSGFSFIPNSITGASANPKFLDKKCFGYDLRTEEDIKNFSLLYLIKAYNNYQKKEEFFISFFDKLAGTDQLRKMIIAGNSEDQIRKTWEIDIATFRQTRSKYLLYTDFE